MEYEVAQPAGQTVAQLVTVGIESQPQDWVMVEIWRQARRMQEVMAVQLGSSVEVIVRQVVGVGSGGYGVIVGGRGVSARMRGARTVTLGQPHKEPTTPNLWTGSKRRTREREKHRGRGGVCQSPAGLTSTRMRMRIRMR